jgi:hypothetical protein
MMKPGSIIFRTLLVMLLLLGACALASSDEVTVNVVARVLQSFDPDEASREVGRTWALLPSKFGYDSKGNSMWQIRKVDSWPESLYGKNKDKEKLQVLGISGAFSRKGYNYVEIVPGTGEDKSFKPKPIPIPGRVEAIDLWVWGANYAYSLEAHVRDFQGIDHVLPFGFLQFAGWKNLRCKIPGNIPQVWKYLPRLRNLELTKLVLWTQPQEKVDEFYMYLDQIKVTTDLYETTFDGDELADADKLQEIWGAAKQ